MGRSVWNCTRTNRFILLPSHLMDEWRQIGDMWRQTGDMWRPVKTGSFHLSYHSSLTDSSSLSIPSKVRRGRKLEKYESKHANECLLLSRAGESEDFRPTPTPDPRVDFWKKMTPTPDSGVDFWNCRLQLTTILIQPTPYHWITESNSQFRESFFSQNSDILCQL